MSKEINLSTLLNGDNPDENNEISIDNTPVEKSDSIEINLTDTAATNNNDKVEGYRIVTNRRRPVVENKEEVKEISLADIPETIPQEKPREKSIIEKAFNQLDADITRRQNEFKEAMDSMLEQDATNRMNIEAGLDTVEGEIVYRLDEEKSNTTNTKASNKDDLDEVEKDFESEAIYSSSENVNRKIRITNEEDNPFYMKDNIIEVQNNEPILEEVTDTVVEESTISEEEAITSTKEEIIKEPVKEVTYEIVDGTKSEDTTPKITPVVEAAKPKTVTSGLDDRFVVPTTKVKSTVNTDLPTVDSNINASDFTLDDDDFIELDDYEAKSDNHTEEDVTNTEGFKNLKNDILNKIVNVSKRINTNGFVISKKSLSVTKAIKNRTESKTIINEGRFPLMYTGRLFTASPLTGQELVSLERTDNGFTMHHAGIFYNHDTNQYKPKSIVEWAKTICVLDLKYMYGAFYMANFGLGNNYLPYSCEDPACGHMFLSDNIGIKSMIKFPTKKSEDRYNKILNTPLTEDDSTAIETAIVPINEYYAVGIKLPSLYNSVFELGNVNQEFIEKYSSVINTIMYIDTIYVIDSDTQEFIPLDYKIYPGDLGKTFKSKIVAYSTIINKFDATDYDILYAYINSISVDYEVELVRPEITCTKCGKTIHETKLDLTSAVFLQRQLMNTAIMQKES